MRVSSSLKRDFLASIVVFLVALPLCMGIAVASGMPPGAGLITGIIGGFVVGALAGCPLQVSGPAAGLSVVVWDLIQTHGAEKLGLIILLAGVIQLVAAWLQIGQWFRAVSPAVVHGMLAGLGALLIAGQLHIMIDDVPKSSGLQNILTIPDGLWKAVMSGSTGHRMAAGIGVLTILVIVLWNRLRWKPLQVMPAVLVGVIVATVVAFVQAFPIAYVKVRDNPFTVIHLPDLEALGHLLDPSILSAGLATALIASVETLLCATAVDHLHTGRRTRYNRELMAQGTGNVACGLLGGLPMSGVIVRSSANIQAGAQTRLSAVLHGAWLFLFVAFLPWMLRLIPTSSLAAVLVFTGYKLMDLSVVKELKEHGRDEVVIYFVTMGAIVATNLLTGVLVGVGLALFKLVYTTTFLETRLDPDPDREGLIFWVAGVATFISLPKLATGLEDVPPGSSVTLHFQSLRHIDHACLNLIETWKKVHEAGGGKVDVDWEGLKKKTYHLRHRKKAPASGAVPAAAARPAP